MPVTLYHHKDSGRPIPVTAVVLTEVQIPFWNLVVLLVKLAFAAIPAAIIIAVVWAAIYATLYAFIGGAIFSAFHN